MEIYMVFLDENSKFCNSVGFPKLIYKVSAIPFKDRDFQRDVGKTIINIHVEERKNTFLRKNSEEGISFPSIKKRL